METLMCRRNRALLRPWCALLLIQPISCRYRHNSLLHEYTPDIFPIAFMSFIVLFIRKCQSTQVQRKKKVGRYKPSELPTHASAARGILLLVTSTSAASKFTSLQPARHPLSLSVLNSAVQKAIAAKRYTCCGQVVDSEFAEILDFGSCRLLDRIMAQKFGWFF
jgi:hypothetical protein